MTDHPITPPPELVQQWLGTYFGTTVTGEVSDVELALATQAARWGSDQELEACCEWVNDNVPCGYGPPGEELRAARRPKPPSLKERALQAWAAVEAGTDDQVAMAVIRRALEELPE
jgi:hypothetical protein